MISCVFEYLWDMALLCRMYKLLLLLLQKVPFFRLSIFSLHFFFKLGKLYLSDAYRIPVWKLPQRYNSQSTIEELYVQCMYSIYFPAYC